MHVDDYHALGTEPGYCHHCHTGRCPVGITTQDAQLMERLNIDEAAERVSNFLRVMTMEIQMLARACGKSDVHHLEPEDMAALTAEASMICACRSRARERSYGGSLVVPLRCPFCGPRSVYEFGFGGETESDPIPMRTSQRGAALFSGGPTTPGFRISGGATPADVDSGWWRAAIR